MNPKKAKELNKLTAEALNKDQELVDDIVDFYWLKVRKMLGSIEHPYIRMPNLGTFNIRYKNLVGKIHLIDKVLEQPAPTSFIKYITYNSHMEKIQRYREAKEIMDEYINKKTQHRNAKKAKKNLED